MAAVQERGPRRTRHRGGARSRGEGGVVLVVALIVTLLLVLASIAAVNQTIGSITQSGIASKQVTSTDAAEAGIEQVIQAVTANPTTFSCVRSTILDQSSSLPGGDATVTLSYSASNSLSSLGTPSSSSCTQPAYTFSTTFPTYLLVQAVGSGNATGFGAKTLEALLTVTPASSDLATQAIHGDQGVTFQNAAVLTGPAANIYAGNGSGGLPCSGSGGTIVSTGNVYTTDTSTWNINNGCVITGNIYSAGPIAFGSSLPKVTGSINTPSTITFQNPPLLPDGSANAGGNITYPLLGLPTTVSNSQCSLLIFLLGCTTDNPAVQAPASDPVPAITAANFPASSWNITTVASCSQTSIMSAIDAASSVGSGKQEVVLPANCQWQPNGTPLLPLLNTLAIIMPGGMSATNGFGFTSASLQNLYLVVPSPSTAALSINSGLFTNVNTFMYTMGNVNLLNSPASATINGQIFAGGTVSANAGINLDFTPFSIAGLTGSGSVAVDWERQTA